MSISATDSVQVHARLQIDVFFKQEKVEPCPITKLLVSNDDGATYADVYVSDKGLATIDWKWTGCKRPNLDMCMNDVFKFFFYSKKEPGVHGKGQFHIFCGGGHCSAEAFLHAAANTRDNAAQEPSVHAGHNVSGMQVFATMLPHPERHAEAEVALNAFKTLQSTGKITKSVLWDSEKMTAIQMKEASNIAGWIKKECVLEAKNGDSNFAKPLTPMHLFNVCQLYMDISSAANTSPHIRYSKVAIALAVSVDCMIKNFHSLDFMHMQEEPFVFCANEVLTWFTMDPEKAKYRFDETLVSEDHENADANADAADSVAGHTDNTNIRLSLYDDRLNQVITNNRKLHVAGSECVDRAMAEPNVNGFDTVAGNDCEDFSAAAQATHMGICQMGPPAKVVLQRRNPDLLARMADDMHDSVDMTNVPQEEIVDCEAALQSSIFEQCDARHLDGILVFCIRYADLVNKQVIEYQNCLGTALGASADKKTRQLGGHAYGKTLYRPSNGTAVCLGTHSTAANDAVTGRKNAHCQAQLLVVEGTSSVQNMELDNQNCTVPLAVTVPVNERTEFENNGFKCIGSASDTQDTQVVMEKVVGAAEFLAAIGANPFMQVRSASSRRSIPFSVIHRYGQKALHGDNAKSQQQNNSFYQKVFITGDKLVFERSHKKQGKQHFGVAFLDFAAKLDHIVLKKAAGGGMSASEFSQLQTYKKGLWREAFPPSVTDQMFDKNLERSMEKVQITAEPLGAHVNDYLKNCWMTFVSESFATADEQQALLQNAAMTCSCFNAQMQAQGSPHRMLCKVAMSSVFRILMFDRTILRNEATHRHAIRDAVRRIQEQNAQGNRQ